MFLLPKTSASLLTLVLLLPRNCEARQSTEMIVSKNVLSFMPL
jgi:hypothetical protein